MAVERGNYCPFCGEGYPPGRDDAKAGWDALDQIARLVEALRIANSILSTEGLGDGRINDALREHGIDPDERWYGYEARPVRPVCVRCGRPFGGGSAHGPGFCIDLHRSGEFWVLVANADDEASYGPFANEAEAKAFAHEIVELRQIGWDGGPVFGFWTSVVAEAV